MSVSQAVSQDPDFPARSREEVISLAPFTVRRVARWSECDPAGVVYTGQICEYLLSAVHLFRLHLFGSWKEMRGTLHVDLPAKAMSLVFKGSLWPDDVFEIAVFVDQIRTRTFDVVAEAVRRDSREPVFDGRFSSICISSTDRGASLPLPPMLRNRLEAAATILPPPAHLGKMSKCGVSETR